MSITCPLCRRRMHGGAETGVDQRLQMMSNLGAGFFSRPPLLLYFRCVGILFLQ